MTLAALAMFVIPAAGPAYPQDIPPELMDEAVRRSGMSREEILARAQQEGAVDTTAVEPAEPGREDLGGIDDRAPWKDTDAVVVLPSGGVGGPEPVPTEEAVEKTGRGPNAYFGRDFFRLDEGVFQPPSFGPVSADYRLGVGDEIIINVWGGVDLQITRVVDRDGSIILPRVGKITCAGRSLGEIDNSIRKQLARSHASIDIDGYEGKDEGDTFVEVTLGHLRVIRVFVIGEGVRPGSYELSSASTILTALYAASGPSEQGSFRDIRLMRGDKTVASLDLYEYLLSGTRDADARLHEGDTVFIPGRGPTVSITGGVQRSLRFEMTEGEGLADLIGYAGGFRATAAPEIIHIRRIIPLGEREPGQPDHVFLDVPFDPLAMRSADGSDIPLLDGDQVTITDIGDRLDNWVRISGSVKRPGQYQFQEGMTIQDLLEASEGLWPDALTERAVIDRTSPEQHLSTITIALDEVLAGTAEPVALQAKDEIRIFSRWDTQSRPQITISGEVYNPFSIDFREGMTLRDLILRAGGLRSSANMMRAEVSRLQEDALMSTDLAARPERTVEVIQLEIGADFLTREDSFELMPYDRVAIRRLPWWEMQKTVILRGEVFFPGVFSLERKDETLSSLIARAGGLTPDAYLTGARIERTQDEVGNIAIDLMMALTEPGSPFDIILQQGDVIVIPDRMFTVKVVGEVGFPTSLVHEDGKDINWYVDRAGGYLKKSDKKRARVVWPNGMSLPNKGGSQVVAGSTIIVPLKPPPEGKTTLETVRDITGIVASLAMVWLVIDNTTK